MNAALVVTLLVLGAAVPAAAAPSSNNIQGQECVEICGGINGNGCTFDSTPFPWSMTPPRFGGGGEAMNGRTNAQPRCKDSDPSYDPTYLNISFQAFGTLSWNGVAPQVVAGGGAGTVLHCSFLSNIWQGFPGVSVAFLHATVSHSFFYANAGTGAGVYAHGTATITASTFKKNRAGGLGGEPIGTGSAVQIMGGFGKLKACDFVENGPALQGGAVYMAAERTSAGPHGATAGVRDTLGTRPHQLEVDDCMFTSNQAMDGAAIYATASFKACANEYEDAARNWKVIGTPAVVSTCADGKRASDGITFEGYNQALPKVVLKNCLFTSNNQILPGTGPNWSSNQPECDRVVDALTMAARRPRDCGLRSIPPTFVFQTTSCPSGRYINPASDLGWTALSPAVVVDAYGHSVAMTANRSSPSLGYAVWSQNMEGCPARCDAGQYGPGSPGGTTRAAQCQVCPQGFYWTEETPATGIRSTRGAGSVDRGPGHAVTVCPACPSGRMNSGNGMIGVETCAACAAGTACIDGVRETCSGNPAKFYCPAETVVKMIAMPGEYTIDANGNTTGLRVDKRTCEAGYSCGGGRRERCVSHVDKTVVGSFQHLTEKDHCTDCTSCPSGFQETVACTPTSDTKCEECGRGMYSMSAYLMTIKDPTDHKTTCITCPDNTFASEMRAQSCTDKTKCLAGREAAAAAPMSAKTEDARCEQCPPGKISGFDSSCETCATGKFQANAGESICGDCAIGVAGEERSSACSSTADASWSQCAAGKFSTEAMRIGGNYSCQDCPANWFQSGTGAQVCTACDVCGTGHQVSSVCTPASNTACTQCASGKFSTVTDTTCLDCDPGASEFQSQGGKGYCDTCAFCAVGQHVDADCAAATDRTCRDCPSGWFTSTPNEATCTACPAGHRATGSGASGCTACANGKIQHATGQAVCTMCMPGQFAGNMSEPCVACPAGKWNEDPGQLTCEECLTCGPGKHIQQECASRTNRRCSDCPAGQLTTSINQAQCDACPSGQWQDAAGAVSCKACTTCGSGQDGMTAEGACTVTRDSTCADCRAGRFSDGVGPCKTCPVGFSAFVTAAKQCNKCETGFFAHAKGALDCEECPDDSDTASSPNVCKCNVGFVAWDYTLLNTSSIPASSTSNSGNGTDAGARMHAAECGPCPVGGNCETNAGVVLATLQAQVGYWSCRSWTTDLAADLRLPLPGSTASASAGVVDPACVETEGSGLVRIDPSKMVGFDKCAYAPACGGGATWSSCAKGYAGPTCLACDSMHYRTAGTCVACGNSAERAFTAIAVVLALLVVFAIGLQLKKTQAGKRNRVTPAADSATEGKTKRKGKERMGLRRSMSLRLKKTSEVGKHLKGTWDLVGAEKLKSIVSYFQLLNAFTKPAASGVTPPPAYKNLVDNVGSVIAVDLFSLFRAPCMFGSSYDFFSDFLAVTLFQIGLIALGIGLVAYNTKKGRDAAAGKYKKFVCLFTFLIFPGLCSKIFSIFNCTTLGDGRRHLAADPREICFQGRHMTYTIVAVVLVGIVPLGVPLSLLMLLRRAKRKNSLYAAEEAGDRNAETGQLENVRPHESMEYCKALFARYEPVAYYFEVIQLLFKVIFSGFLVVLGASAGGGKSASVLQLTCAFVAMVVFQLITSTLMPFIHDSDDLLWNISLGCLCLAIFAAVLNAGASTFGPSSGLTEARLGAALTIIGFLPLVAAAYLFYADLRKRKDKILRGLEEVQRKEEAEEEEEGADEKSEIGPPSQQGEAGAEANKNKPVREAKTKTVASPLQSSRVLSAETAAMVGAVGVSAAQLLANNTAGVGSETG